MGILFCGLLPQKGESKVSILRFPGISEIFNVFTNWILNRRLVTNIERKISKTSKIPSLQIIDKSRFKAPAFQTGFRPIRYSNLATSQNNWSSFPSWNEVTPRKIENTINRLTRDIDRDGVGGISSFSFFHRQHFKKREI